MKTFKLEILNTMLRLWEDANIFGEFAFQNYLKEDFKGNVHEKMFQTLPGSEIDEHGAILRSIPEYMNLRKFLEAGKEFDFRQFLPRVPKHLKGKIGDNKELFIESMNVGDGLSFPKLIGKWMRSKKICAITEEAEIPLISPSEANYLQYLPYDNFIITTDSTFEDTMVEKKLTYRTLMVSRQVDYLYVLCIPEEINEYTYTDEERKIFDKLTILRKGKNEKLYEKEKTSILKKTQNSNKDTLIGNYHPQCMLYPQMNMINMVTGEYSVTWSDMEVHEHSFSPSNFDEANRSSMYASCLVNGLCKILSEHTKVSGVTFESVSYNEPRISSPAKSSLEKNIKEKLEWNEVPQGQVIHLLIEKGPDNVGVVMRHGSEKSFHVRRGHWRHLIQQDGTTKDIWIKQMNVREDLIEEGVKSGLSTIAK